MSKKMCKLVVKKGLHNQDLEKFMSLVGDSRCMCTACGRTAAKAKYLCKPSKS